MLMLIFISLILQDTNFYLFKEIHNVLQGSYK